MRNQKKVEAAAYNSGSVNGEVAVSSPGSEASPITYFLEGTGIAS
jgi:hypothetical protein